MANAHGFIAKSTVGSGGASFIEFTSIPQIYTDLVVLMSGRSTTGSPDAGLQFNGQGSSNISSRYMFAVDGSVTRGSDNSIQLVGLPKSGTTSNTFGNVTIYITNYTSSQQKAISVESVTENMSSSETFLALTAGLYSSSSAISSLKLTGDFAQYSSAYLYGISKS